MKRILAPVVLALAFVGAAVAQEGDKPKPADAAKSAAVKPMTATEGDRWIYIPSIGGAIGWSTNSIAVDIEAQTARVVRVGYFAEEQKKPAPFSWLFQDVTYDCANKTVKIEAGQFVNKQRELTPIVQGSQEAKPVVAPTDEGLFQVVCKSVKLKRPNVANGIKAMMDGVEMLPVIKPAEQPAATPAQAAP